MNKKKVLGRVLTFFTILISGTLLIGTQINVCYAGPNIYRGDDIVPMHLKRPYPQPIPYGTDVKSKLFDGYPQLMKKALSKPVYKGKVKVEKDVWVPMRDGVRLVADIYRPDVEGKKFPVILSYAAWGKELNEITRWLPEQPYWHGPFWDGCIEAGEIDYLVERGYVRVITDPRNRGKSEGTTNETPEDGYDVIEWIAKQPWCDGNVGMIGACGYAGRQLQICSLDKTPAALKAICPFENIRGNGDSYDGGIFGCMSMNIMTARHGNDSLGPPYRVPPGSKYVEQTPQAQLEAWIQEALQDPDIKYNGRYYSIIKYPMSAPRVFDQLMDYFHPKPFPPSKLENIKIPIYMSTPWNELLYTWETFEAWRTISSPDKKLGLWPSKAPGRPFTAYSDEMLRWHDYWLKGIDNGIMDEPPIVMFVMGIDKWRFEDEWPLARAKYNKFYLHPGGVLSPEPVKEGGAKLETFTQPALYLDPKVYCLEYTTEPLQEPIEITGPMSLHLEASIDQDNVNWFVDLVDVDPYNKKRLVCTGYLRASMRTLDKAKSKPYRPIYVRQEHVPVTPNKAIDYDICFMPSSNVFQRGHKMQLIIRTQDDLMSRLGLWGVYFLPTMRTTTCNIYFGKSHLFLPVVPIPEDQVEPAPPDFIKIKTLNVVDYDY